MELDKDLIIRNKISMSSHNKLQKRTANPSIVLTDSHQHVHSFFYHKQTLA